MTSATGVLLLRILSEKQLDSPMIYQEACLRTGKDFLAGTIKSSVSRLRKKGLIEDIDIKTDGRLRRVYGITADGTALLEEYQQLFTPTLGGPNCAATT
jgi:DNA-binding PadR family transcriptional regulator